MLLNPERSVVFISPLGLVLCLLLMAGSGNSFANKPNDITEAEMRLLPTYCPDTMGFNYGDAYSNTSPKAGHWVSLMGKSFWAMHHYCWALINLGRAQKAGIAQEQRLALYDSVRGDYQYVLRNSSPDFIMLPELYSRLGQVELQLSRPEKAGAAFAKARELKPDYWPAYSHWAEFLIAKGKRAEAMRVVLAGLEYSPRARVLLEQYRLLGGKPANLPKPKSPPSAEVAAEQMNQPEAEARDEAARTDQPGAER